MRRKASFFHKKDSLRTYFAKVDLIKIIYIKNFAIINSLIPKQNTFHEVFITYFGNKHIFAHTLMLLNSYINFWILIATNILFSTAPNLFKVKQNVLFKTFTIKKKKKKEYTNDNNKIMLILNRQQIILLGIKIYMIEIVWFCMIGLLK